MRNVLHMIVYGPHVRSPVERQCRRRHSRHDGERCHFVKYHEAQLLEVDGNYVTLFFRDTRAMQYVEGRLDPALFFRANRQQLVNLNYVAAIEPWIGDGLMIRMQDGKEVHVSRELKQRLES